MNTTVLHTNGTSPENPLKNNCYATLPQELYHEVDSGGVRGKKSQRLGFFLSM